MIKRGPPRKPERERKRLSHFIRLSLDERLAILRAAKAYDLPVATWARMQILRAASNWMVER
mgnify:CR=1 FL=1